MANHQHSHPNKQVLSQIPKKGHLFHPGFNKVFKNRNRGPPGGKYSLLTLKNVSKLQKLSHFSRVILRCLAKTNGYMWRGRSLCSSEVTDQSDASAMVTIIPASTIDIITSFLKRALRCQKKDQAIFFLSLQKHLSWSICLRLICPCTLEGNRNSY